MKQIFPIAIVILLLAVAGWYWMHREPDFGPGEGERQSPGEAEIPSLTLPGELPIPGEWARQSNEGPRANDENVSEYASNLFAQLNHPKGSLAKDVKIIALVLQRYEFDQRNPPPADPVKLVQALRGANPTQVKYLPPGQPDVHDGKLHDRYGSPFHFQVDASSVAIRSAGPDGNLNSEDDFFFRMPRIVIEN